MYATDYFEVVSDRLSFPFIQPSSPPTSVVDAAGLTRFTLSARPKAVLRNRGGFSTSFHVSKLIPFYVPVDDTIHCLVGKTVMSLLDNTNPSGVRPGIPKAAQEEFTLKFGDFPVVYWILKGAELESSPVSGLGKSTEILRLHFLTPTL